MTREPLSQTVNASSKPHHYPPRFPIHPSAARSNLRRNDLFKVPYVCTSTATFPQRGRIRSFNATAHTFLSATAAAAGSSDHPVLRNHRAGTNVFFERGHPYSSALSGLRVYVAARGEKSFYKRGCFLFLRRLSSISLYIYTFAGCL